jgi:two-component system sensor histidine kinase YesM
LQDGLVFSVRRPVEFPGFNSHVFIESEIGFVDRLLFVERFGTEPRYVFAADDGRVVFSMVPHIEVGSVVETATPTVPGLVTLTLLDDSVPWQIYGFLSRSDMLAPLRTWVFQYLLVLAASVAVFVVVTRLGWNAMSRRLDDVGERVRLLTEQGFDEEVTPIGVEEFDAVLGQMEGLRQRVVSLIEQVRDESAQRHASELEALRSQINPHFLHNTLNIIQWIAKMNGQNQIDRIAAILTRLLHHGLGREGPTVTLREELDAVRDYLELQRFRFDFEYRIDVALAEDALDLQIPRFLLQPVVENALYHGLDRGRGRITVLATHNGDQIRFHVKDNGKGIGPEEIDALLSDRGPNTRHGIGIGLRYVSSTLADRYGDHASLNVSSRPGEGTLFAVEIPVAR